MAILALCLLTAPGVRSWASEAQPKPDQLAMAQMPMPPLMMLPGMRTLPQASALSDNRRQSVVDDLYTRLMTHRESFWTTVYPLYMQREITRSHVRDLVQKGLEEARGNYKIMVRLFNMEPGDYKRFLNFLRKHQCQLPFKEYRQVDPASLPKPAGGVPAAL